MVWKQLTHLRNFFKMNTWASIVPLIGGETIAMENIFKTKPKYFLTSASNLSRRLAIYITLDFIL